MYTGARVFNNIILNSRFGDFATRDENREYFRLNSHPVRPVDIWTHVVMRRYTMLSCIRKKLKNK